MNSVSIADARFGMTKVDHTSSMEWKGEDLDIAPHGDVVALLTYTPADSSACSTARVRVDSRVLQAASEVFRALLKPSFQEGDKLECDKLTEVSFSEDDGRAMVTLFKALHFQFKQLTTPESRGCPLKFALVVDAYDCAASTVLLWREWMRSITHNYSHWLFEDPEYAHECRLVAALEACYVLLDEENFEKLSAKLLFESRCSILMHLAETEYLPKKAYVDLETRRQTLRGKYCDLVHRQTELQGICGDMSEEAHAGAHKIGCCPRQHQMATKLLACLEHAEIWPLHRLPQSIERIHAKFLSLFNLPVEDLPKCNPDCAFFRDLEEAETQETLFLKKGLRQDAIWAYEGSEEEDVLCLRCVKEEEKWGKGSKCQKHDGEDTIDWENRFKVGIQLT